MSDRFHIVLYMSLVDDQRLHTIVCLVSVFYHAQRKPIEGSLDEACASTAAKQRIPQNVPDARMHQTQQQQRQ